ncbi:MAG TPA: type II toxin-antitoxin system VapB family antitoxin [Capsulimonadaceae bacterium]|jgi:antitoxin VapB
MSLNIKDEEAHRLAQAISRETGESMTRVVIEALRDRNAKIETRKSKVTVGELLAIADRPAMHLHRTYVSHDELLYDENGLPRR